ncbi:ferritin-like domain-containing protein [Dissophora ornata]|nr:hypothetical protein BGZ58_008903 [Dissophora ornata]KAI8603250.1 ferritin-like domain-containing protein [Dissophora ornata]
MRFSTIACAITAVAAVVTAAPTPMPPKATSILNYALTLEHLESEFYKEGLAKFGHRAFIDAGFSAEVRDRIVHIGEHENVHVSTLTSVITSLKGTPVPACTYNFPLDNVNQFLAVAQALENTGVSAYLGAAAGLSGDLLTAAGTIVTVEARHVSYLSEIWGESGLPYSFDTPLSPQQVVTMATTLITECPYDLGVTPFNHLTATLPQAGSKMVGTTFTGKGSGDFDNTYCQFLYGNMNSISVRKDCTLPEDAVGYVYVLVTDSMTPVTLTSQSNILAGPTLLFNGDHTH